MIQNSKASFHRIGFGYFRSNNGFIYTDSDAPQLHPGQVTVSSVNDTHLFLTSRTGNSPPSTFVLHVDEGEFTYMGIALDANEAVCALLSGSDFGHNEIRKASQRVTSFV